MCLPRYPSTFSGNPVYRSLRADNPGIPAKAQISSVLVLGGSVVVVWVIEGDNATGILL